MKMKGGYQILDLKNVPMEIGVPVKVEGSFEHCDGHGKPILIMGFNGLANEAIPNGAFTSMWVDDAGAFIGTFLSRYSFGEGLIVYTIEVDMNDMVTITKETIPAGTGD